MPEPELFWDDEFEWFEQASITDEEAERLTIDEIIARERKLAHLLGAFAGRWVLVKNSNVVTSGENLAHLLKTGRDGAVMYIPEGTSPGFYIDMGFIGQDAA